MKSIVKYACCFYFFIYIHQIKYEKNKIKNKINEKCKWLKLRDMNREQSHKEASYIRQQTYKKKC